MVKARETGGSGMIISEILCFFLLKQLPILLAPSPFSPLCGWVSCKYRNQAKRESKAGIYRHYNKKDMGIPNFF